MSTETDYASSGDRSNGYEAVGAEFMRRPEASSIGVATVRLWARLLPSGETVLDLGCGSGEPISTALNDDARLQLGEDDEAGNPGIQ